MNSCLPINKLEQAIIARFLFLSLTFHCKWKSESKRLRIHSYSWYLKIADILKSFSDYQSTWLEKSNLLNDIVSNLCQVTLQVLLVTCNLVLLATCLDHQWLNWFLIQGFLIRNVDIHAARIYTKNCPRVKEHSCRINRYLAQWGGKLVFIAIAVMICHLWAKCFLGRS